MRFRAGVLATAALAFHGLPASAQAVEQPADDKAFALGQIIVTGKRDADAVIGGSIVNSERSTRSTAPAWTTRRT